MLSAGKNDNNYTKIPLRKSAVKGHNLKVGDIIEITISNFMRYECEKTLGCVSNLYECLNDGVVLDVKKVEGKVALSWSLFDNMVSAKAARILLEQTPETVKNMEKQLKTSLNTSDKLIEKSFKVITGKDKLTKETEKEAIVQIMRDRYGVKLRNKKQQDLAYALYSNLVMGEAVELLLRPENANSVAAISGELYDFSRKSAETNDKAIKKLR